MGRDCCGTHEEEVECVKEAPVLPKEITKTVISAGSGGFPQKGDEVRVHYTGWLQSDGSKFDSSVDRGQLFTFTLGNGQVIKGWDFGVATMQKGEKSRFILPSKFAYGDSGSPPKIPGGATLEFEIELFSFGSDKDLFNDGRVIYRYIHKSNDWKTPSEGDQVHFTLQTDQGESNFVHTLHQPHPLLDSELLDTLLAELKSGDSVVVTLEDTQVQAKNNNLTEFTLTVKQIVKVEDVSLTPGDKRVFKKTLVAGEDYKTPEIGSCVTVAVEVSNADGFVLLSQDAVVFVLGECAHSELLEAAVAKMTLNETALVWAGDQQTIVVQDALLAYPVETGLQFRVTLKTFTAAKAFFALKPEEKLQMAETAKETGSRVLKEGRVYLATEKYKQAVKIFEFKDNDTVQVKTLIKACRLNLAMCYLKLSLFTKTIEETDKILKDDPLNVKALYRKAAAYHKLSEHDKAHDILKKLIDTDAENAEAKQLLVSVKDAIKQDNNKQKGLFAKMFQAVGRD